MVAIERPGPSNIREVQEMSVDQLNQDLANRQIINYAREDEQKNLSESDYRTQYEEMARLKGYSDEATTKALDELDSAISTVGFDYISTQRPMEAWLQDSIEDWDEKIHEKTLTTKRNRKTNKLETTQTKVNEEVYDINTRAPKKWSEVQREFIAHKVLSDGRYNEIFKQRAKEFNIPQEDLNEFMKTNDTNSARLSKSMAHFLNTMEKEGEYKYENEFPERLADEAKFEEVTNFFAKDGFLQKAIDEPEGFMKVREHFKYLENIPDSQIAQLSPERQEKIKENREHLAKIKQKDWDKMITYQGELGDQEGKDFKKQWLAEKVLKYSQEHAARKKIIEAIPPFEPQKEDESDYDFKQRKKKDKKMRKEQNQVAFEADVSAREAEKLFKLENGDMWGSNIPGGKWLLEKGIRTAASFDRNFLNADADWAVGFGVTAWASKGLWLPVVAFSALADKIKKSFKIGDGFLGFMKAQTPDFFGKL